MCSGSLPAFVDCQKDSGSAVEKRTQVKPVLLAVKIFAVELGILPLLACTNQYTVKEDECDTFGHL